MATALFSFNMKKTFFWTLTFIAVISVVFAADVRIKNLANTTTSPASDDYVAVDGTTNGTRKMLLSTATISTSGNITGNVGTFTSGNFTSGNVTTLTATNIVISGYNQTQSASGNMTVTWPAGTYTLGYANIPQNNITANYTTVATDASKNIIHTSSASGNHTVTVNNTAHANGDVISVMNAKSGTTVTLTLSSGNFTIYQGNLTSTGSSASLPAGTWATIYRIATGDWAIGGAGVTIP